MLRPLRWRVLFAGALLWLCIASSVGLLATGAGLVMLAASQPGVHALALGSTGVRFFGLARGALRYAERLLGHATAFQVLARWRAYFFARLEPLAPYGLGGHSSGDLLSRLGHDVDKLEGLYTRVLSPALSAFGVGVAVLVWMGSLGKEYALVWGLAYLVAFASPLAWAFGLGRAAKAQGEARGVMASSALQLVEGMAEIQVLGLKTKWLQGLRERGEAEDEAALRGHGQMAGAEAWSGLWAGFSVIGLLALAARPVAEGGLNPISAVAAVLGGLAAFEAVQPSVAMVAHAGAGLSAGRRLLEVAHLKPVVLEPEGGEPSPVEGAPLLEARGLSFAFPGGGPLFRLDFTLGAGEVLLLRGPSGSGKSTLAALLARLLEYEGSLRLHGRELRLLSGESVRRTICLLDQETHLFTDTLAENLRLVDGSASDEELTQVLSAVGLGDFLAALPEGLSTWLGERGQALSGGERQRIAAARALLGKAPLVVADEPAAHLHATAERQLLEAFAQAAHRPAVLWISHRMEEQTFWPSLCLGVPSLEAREAPDIERE